MDDALPVGVGQRPCGIAQHPSGFRGRQRSSPPDTFSQCFAFDVGHGKEHERADLFDRMNRNNIRMGELRRGAGLVQKSLA